MRIVTTTSVFPRGYAAKRALERLAAVGFEGLDIALDYCVAPGEPNPKPSPYLHTDPEYPFESDGWEAWAGSLRARADELGVRYTHAHAPGEADRHDGIMLRCFEVCRILGAGHIVVHPVWRDARGRIYEDEEEFIRVNVEATKPLLEAAERNGVVILSENLLWGASRSPKSIANLVAEINSPYFGWCYDSGHANCFDIRPEILREVSRVPLSLHMQDNHGGLRDEHLFPGDGTIDWKAFLDTLKAIGYCGDLVIEAHHQPIEAPDAERETLMGDLLARCRKMRAYLERQM